MTREQAVRQGFPRGEITKNLLAWSAGDDGAAAPAFSALYAMLRRLARRALSAERSDHTLGTAGLISEAYFRLREQQRVEWRSREHFIATAAQMMRRILVDHARARRAAKRPGALKVVLDDRIGATRPRDFDLLALDEALDDLATFDPQLGRIVELRYFGGLSETEVAEVLSMSRSTVTREWQTARAWLYRRMTQAPGRSARK